MRKTITVPAEAVASAARKLTRPLVAWMSHDGDLDFGVDDMLVMGVDEEGRPILAPSHYSLVGSFETYKSWRRRQK